MSLAIHSAQWIGFAALLVSVILSNIAFFKIVRAVNKVCNPGHRLDPWNLMGHVSTKRVIERIRMYRTAYGDGPLWQRLKFAYWLCGISAAITIGSSFLLQKF